MAYGTPADPVGGTIITVAYAVSNLLNPIRWLRLLTGNADPPGSSYVVVSDSTTGTTWRKIPSDALAAGVALANLGYTPVNRAGDLSLGGALGWGPTVYLAGTSPNQLFLVTGQSVYLVDAANPGVPAGTFDVVNKTFAMAGGAFAIGSLTLSAALAAVSAVFSGAISAASATLSGAISAASAAISGNATVGGTLGVSSTATLSGNATVGGTLGVTGTATVGALIDNGNANIAGNTAIGGTLAVTGAQTNSSSVTATRLISTIATGTPPLNVTSTTKVDNLNVDLHNGARASTTPGAGIIPITDGSGQIAAGFVPGSVGAPLVGQVIEMANTSLTAAHAAGYLTCDGSAVSRTTHAALFAAIGGQYGIGDGSTTFNVPDLRGRFPLGVDGSHALGATGGAATVDVSHTHTGPSHAHSGASLGISGSTGTESADNGLGNGGGTNTPAVGHTHNQGTLDVTGSTDAAGTGATGTSGSTTQSVLNPYLALNYVIYSGVAT